MKPDIGINCIPQTVKYDRYMKKFQPKTTCQCRAIDARSLKPIRSDFSLLKIFRKLKANKVNTSLVKYTILRASQYEGYIKKFIRLL